MSERRRRLNVSAMAIWHFLAVLGLLLVGCASYAYQDTYWVLDPPGDLPLRDRDSTKDKPLNACDPYVDQAGKKRWPCVVHTTPNYGRLLKEIDRLSNELKACQSQIR